MKMVKRVLGNVGFDALKVACKQTGLSEVEVLKIAFDKKPMRVYDTRDAESKK